MRYHVTASGTWQIGAEPDRPIPHRDEHNTCGLEGIILDEDLRLSAPFPLALDGAFIALQSGHVHIRCRDDWGSLADNQGVVQVRLQREE